MSDPISCEADAVAFARRYSLNLPPEQMARLAEKMGRFPRRGSPGPGPRALARGRPRNRGIHRWIAPEQDWMPCMKRGMTMLTGGSY